MIRLKINNANKPNQTTRKKVAAYVRVSTLHDEQLNSYESQVRTYINMICSNPDYQLITIYGDHGKTGTSIHARPGFNKMLNDAFAGKINLIITKSVSRFARNTLELLVVIRKLKESGVEVFFEEQHLSSFDNKCEAYLSILSALAQEESRNISENIKWGIARKMEKGEFTLPYKRFLGYKNGKNNHPQIVKKEARIIKHIYSLFLHDVSINHICNILEKKGSKTPAGNNKWHYSTVRSILINEKYAGIAFLQKTYTPNYLDHKTAINNGELRRILVRNSHPAIINLEDYIAVQSKLRQAGIKYNSVLRFL